MRTSNSTPMPTAVDALERHWTSVPSAAAAFDAAPWPVAVCDSSLRIHRTNGDMARRFGMVVGDRLTDLLTEDCHDEIAISVTQVLADDHGAGVETYVRSVAGWPAQLHLSRCGEGWFSAWLRPAFDDARHTEMLRQHGQRFEALCANAPAGILCAESGLRVDYVNERCVLVFGAENPDDLWGFGWLDYLAGSGDLTAATASIEEAVSGNTVGPVELNVRRPDGSGRIVEARFAPIGGSDGGFVATVQDVTEARNLAAQLEDQAVRDALTGLPNRRSMVAAIDRMIEQGAGPDGALVFLDLDNFKDVNDTMGHTAGDEMLIEVAARMSSCLRGADMVARFGGDEFVVLLPLSAVTVGDVADRLVRTVGTPYDIAGRETAITASAGIVLIGDSTDAEELLRHADIAMYQAKRAGKNRATLYNPEARVDDERRVALTVALRRALSSDGSDLDVHYQPICDATGHPAGLEALVRWTDPVLGTISPAEFVPIAEGAGLAVELGTLVREIAFADLRNWQAAGWTGHLSINLSAREFANSALVSSMAAQLARHDLGPESILVELTETMLMGNVSDAERVLSAITGSGMRIAIDDFGTGYSSLAYLKRFPVSVVKVDREFVSAIDSSDEDRAICEAIVALAHALDLTVVAEGVETTSQRDVLAELQVPLMQGWLFSEALTRDDVPDVLRLSVLNP